MISENVEIIINKVFLDAIEYGESKKQLSQLDSVEHMEGCKNRLSKVSRHAQRYNVARLNETPIIYYNRSYTYT